MFLDIFFSDTNNNHNDIDFQQRMARPKPFWAGTAPVPPQLSVAPSSGYIRSYQVALPLQELARVGIVNDGSKSTKQRLPY